eukprot:Colp12_sorted_trinity150504_noHs@27009
MSICEEEGKDKIIFVTKEDEAAYKISDEQVEYLAAKGEGAVTPEGDINWDCPCLQGMGEGPCAPEFKEAFSCFLYSESEPKGTECFNAFSSMQDCMARNRDYYSHLKYFDEEEKKEEDSSLSETKAEEAQ